LESIKEIRKFGTTSGEKLLQEHIKIVGALSSKTPSTSF